MKNVLRRFSFALKKVLQNAPKNAIIDGMKNENLFRIFYDRAYAYFTHSFARRIFFFSIVVLAIAAISLQIWSSVFLTYLLLIAAAVCAFATLIDSIQSKQAFLDQLRDLEADYVLRFVEKEGEEALSTLKSVFAYEEIQFMRKKKRDYNFAIFIKFVFMIIFVVLFFNML